SSLFRVLGSAILDPAVEVDDSARSLQVYPAERDHTWFGTPTAPLSRPGAGRPHLWSGPTSPAPSARARRVRGGGDRPDHDEDDVDDHGNEQHERPDDGGIIGGISGLTPLCRRHIRPPPTRQGGSAGGEALALGPVVLA